MSITSNASSGIQVQVHITEPTDPSSSNLHEDRALASPDVWQRLLSDAHDLVHPSTAQEVSGEIAVSLDFGKYSRWNVRRGGMLERPTIFWLSQATQVSLYDH